jgi:6-pyruvoyl-tetrahydropterin synthase
MSRWIVHSQAAFNASHALTSYRGTAEKAHHHEWRVEVRVGTEKLNEDTYALDFHEVHAILSDAVRPLEGSNLNDHPEIGRPSPTAERVAEVFAEELAPLYQALGGQLLSVSVWEGPENRVDLLLDARGRSNVLTF